MEICYKNKNVLDKYSLLYILNIFYYIELYILEYRIYSKEHIDISIIKFVSLVGTFYKKILIGKNNANTRKILYYKCQNKIYIF